MTSLALTSGLQSAFSPQFAPAGGEHKGGGRLVFLSQDAACETGTHDGTVALHSLPWPAEVCDFGPSLPESVQSLCHQPPGCGLSCFMFPSLL